MKKRSLSALALLGMIIGISGSGSGVYTMCYYFSLHRVLSLELRF